MTHWSWYWKIKKNHIPKALCSWSKFCEIDSFNMFKRWELARLVKESKDRTCFTIPEYNLVAILQDNDSIVVNFGNGSYTIVTEKKACNFGGYYYFFCCPQCNSRMRKLYCLEGKYLCRKCANLGYYSQRLQSFNRCMYMQIKVKNFLKNCGGSLEQKPPWMKQYTFERLKKKYARYDERYDYELEKNFSENNLLISPPA